MKAFLLILWVVMVGNFGACLAGEQSLEDRIRELEFKIYGLNKVIENLIKQRQDDTVEACYCNRLDMVNLEKRIKSIEEMIGEDKYPNLPYGYYNKQTITQKIEEIQTSITSMRGAQNSILMENSIKPEPSYTRECLCPSYILQCHCY